VSQKSFLESPQGKALADFPAAFGWPERQANPEIAAQGDKHAIALQPKPPSMPRYPHGQAFLAFNPITQP